MSKGQRPDPRRKKDPTIRSTNFTVPNGGKEFGYMGGEVFGCYGHYVHAHQPCLEDLTGGEVSCPLCLAKFDKVWRGYVPIWDRDFVLHHALISEEYDESVSMIPHRGHIVATRDKPKMSPLVIRAIEPLNVRVLPDKPPYSEPVDMYRICRKLWKNPLVDAWYTSTSGTLRESVGEAVPLDIDKLSPMMKAAGGAVNRRFASPTINEDFVQKVKREAEKPNGNGTHTKPKG